MTDSNSSPSAPGSSGSDMSGSGRVASGTVGRLLSCSVTFRTVERETLDKLALAAECPAIDPADDRSPESRRLDGGLAPESAGSAVVLSTCDRFEVVALARDDAAATAAAIRARIEQAAKMSPAEAETAIATRFGADALAHLFAVTASLDSEVIGEPEISGQVKAAWRRAAEAGTASPELGRLFEAAFAAAKRVRNETAIGERAVSIAAAAVQMSREVLGHFGKAQGLLIGSGEIGALVAERLLAQGLGALTIADTVPARSRALATRLGARADDMEHALDGLDKADIVLAALGGANPRVTARAVARALKARRYRPIILIDAGVPPDIEPAVGELDDAFLFTLGDLEHIALDGLQRRAHEAMAAQLIVEEEVAAFVQAEQYRKAAPVLAALRAHFEAARNRILAENPSADAADATRLLISRLLHGPMTAIRSAGDAGDGPKNGPDTGKDEGNESGDGEDDLAHLSRLFGLKTRNGDHD